MSSSGSGPPGEWFPLTRELTGNDVRGVRASFKPTIAGNYAVTLKFRQPIADADIRARVDLAASTMGIPGSAVPFAFDWRVFEGDQLIASGTGRNGATGVIDTGTHGLGGGPLQSRALAFGTFAAVADRLYTLEFQPATEMTAVLQAKPSLEIALEPARRALSNPDDVRPRGTTSEARDDERSEGRRTAAPKAGGRHSRE